MDGLGLPERAGEGVGEFLEEVQRKSRDEDQDEEM